MHRGAIPSRAMPAAIPGAFTRATMRAPEMKTQSPSGSRGRAGVRISNPPPWLSLLCMVIYIKEEPAMQISVSPTLTVYHDGQFWVGLAEHAEDRTYGVARIVFGTEPSDEEILQFVTSKWAELAFFGGDPAETSKPAKPQATRSRGGASPQAAGDGHQGAAGARESAGGDEAGVGPSKKPASRGRGGDALRAAKAEAQAEASRALIAFCSEP